MQHTTHVVRLRETLVRPVLSGRMRATVRKAERGYQLGDKIVFRACDHAGHEFIYKPVRVGGKVANYPFLPDSCTLGECEELEKKRYRVTHVQGGWGLSAGHVVVCFEEEEDKEASC